jgi:alpha-L-rhamnosidase
MRSTQCRLQNVLRPVVIMLIAGVGLAIGSKANAWEVEPVQLRTAQRSAPTGLDQRHPRLSWSLQVEGQARGVEQTAYRVVVASSRAKLAENTGDLWDTGRVTDAPKTWLRYEGQPLKPHQRVYWKVKVWSSNAGDESETANWSEPATWSMGLFNEQQMGGQWLSYHAQPTRRHPSTGPASLLNFDKVQWVRAAHGTKGQTSRSKRQFFRQTVELSEETRVDWAYLLTAGTHEYQVFANGQKVSESHRAPQCRKEALEIRLTPHMQAGGNVITIRTAASNNEGKSAMAAKLVVVLSNGQRIIRQTGTDWLATRTAEDGLSEIEDDDGAWSKPHALGHVGEHKWGVPRIGYEIGWSQASPSPLLRKAFSIEKPVERAVAYVAGLGYHELFANGQKVSQQVLNPAFTDYEKRYLYVTYDLTDRIQQGQNALGVMLGNGWFNMHTRATWNFDRSPWRGRPRAKVHLRIEHTDGSVSQITTDRSWQANTGPVRVDSIRQGEHYDARQARSGWTKPKYDGSDWHAPKLVEGPKGELSAQTLAPMRVTETIEPKAITEPRPGVYVFDFGQNLAGWCRLKVSGPRGETVTLRYSERVGEHGLIKRPEISKFIFEGPFQTDRYTLSGQGIERWEPSFTYHGFRYVQVTGFPGQPTADSLEARVVHTDFEQAGSFECSDPRMNHVHELARWSYRSNFHGYPTDCPQREKNGWTGDALLAGELAQFTWHNERGYHKWIRDMRDAQRDSGMLPSIVPTGGWGYHWGNGPAWDSALVIIPWLQYVHRGDRQILVDNYQAMKRYVDYVQEKSDKLIADFGLGDWAPADTTTPRALTSTGYFYKDARIVARIAKILGKTGDAKHYANLADRIHKAVNERFYKGDGVYANASQTALSSSIHQQFIQEGEKSAVMKKLVEDIRNNDDHLDVGILGAKYLFDALAENGKADLAYKMAMQPTAPSYGHWLEAGATTMWEHWDGHASLNHIFFGDIVTWSYRHLAGIRPDPAQPGFKHTIFKLNLPKQLQWARAEHQSPFGLIKSHWRYDDDQFIWTVTVPAHTTATVHVLTSAPKAVRVAGQPARKATGVKNVNIEQHTAIVTIGSGRYRFTAPAR